MLFSGVRHIAGWLSSDPCTPGGLQQAGVPPTVEEEGRQPTVIWSVPCYNQCIQ